MKFVKLLFSIVLLILVSITVYAHSGGTDAYGGHYDGNSYHYHHGYPAHQHTHGNCPYDFDDQTNYNSDTNTNEDKSNTDVINNTNMNYCFNDTHLIYEIGFWIFGVVSIVSLIILCKTSEKHSERVRYLNSVNDKEKQHLEQKHFQEVLSLEEKILELKLEFSNREDDLFIYANISPYDLSFFPEYITYDKYTDEFLIKSPLSDKTDNTNIYIASENAKHFHLFENCCGAKSVVRLEDVMYEKTPCSKCCSNDYVCYIYEPFKRAYTEFKRISKYKKENNIP